MLSILHLGHRMFIATRRCLLFSQSVPLRLGSCSCVPSPTGLTRYQHVPSARPLFGMVSRIDLEESELTVDFDGREVDYGFTELDELVLAYATQIPKSQGSDYPDVV